MTEGSDPDWAAIRRAVEAGKEPIVKIAERFGVSAHNIYARKHRWAWSRSIDTSSAAGIERGVAKMVAQIFTQLRAVARTNRAMSREAKTLKAQPADGSTLERRLRQAAEAEARLASIMKLTAEFTRLLDRAARASAAARADEDEAREAYDAFESRILDYVERARAGTVPGDAGPERPPEAGS